jgi:hypothetical protein
MSYYYLAAAVLYMYTNTAVVGVRLWGIHMLCLCGVEVYCMYVIYVNIISRIVGTVQGLGIITPWFRSMSEGVATSLTGPYRGDYHP